MATKPEDKSEDKTEGASALFSAHLAVPPIPCELIHDAVNGLLHERCRGNRTISSIATRRGPTAPVKAAAVTASAGRCRGPT